MKKRKYFIKTLNNIVATNEEYNKYLDKQNEYMEKVKNYKPNPSYLSPKEQKKIPKRIQSNGESLYSEYIGQWLVNTENYTEYDELLMNKINEIIDYLESKGE